MPALYAPNHLLNQLILQDTPGVTQERNRSLVLCASNHSELHKALKSI